MPDTRTDIVLELDAALQRRRLGRPVWQWFDRRVRTHHQAMAARAGRPIPPPDAGRRLDAALAQPGRRPQRVLYLHIPFCQHICTFCSFFRQGVGPALDNYVRALSEEILRVADTPFAKSLPFRAVYFGGGTPTALRADQLADLVHLVRDRFPLALDCEFTVESRFVGVDADYWTRLRQAGVNRLSLGVQTFDTALRQSLGRRADREQLLDLLDRAGRIGFRSISVDLMYNLPGQTPDAWTDDLRALASTPVTGASIYALIPFPNSALMRAIQRGGQPPLPGADYEYELFHLADRILSQRADWRRMSPFHLGQIHRETCVYSRARMGQTDVLGLGCGAGGDLHGLAYMHDMDLSRFTAAAPDHILPVAVCVDQGPRSPALAAYDLFDPEGLDVDALDRLAPSFVPAARRLVELHLLRLEHNRLTLTPDGCFWAYNLMDLLTRAVAGPSAHAHPHAPHHPPRHHDLAHAT